jgi:hypothetical protein
MTEEHRKRIEQLIEAQYREWERIGYVDTPIDAIRNALDLVIYGFHVFAAVNAGRFTPDTFLRPLRIHTGGPGITIDKTYTADQFKGAAWNLMLSALETSAIATDTALESLGPRNSEDTSDLGSARNIVYQIRNAFAHNPFHPRWHCDQRYRRIYRVTPIGVEFDGQACNGQEWKPEHFGGLEGYLALLLFCLDELKKSQLSPEKT